MKTSILTLALGLVAGLAAYSIYYNSFKPCEEESLECQLSWIQDYLSLSEAQFEVVVAMHRDYQPEVTELEKQIGVLEQRLASLEEERVENDRIDFIAFYNYLQDKGALDKERDSSTENFLSKVGDVMNEDQKARFHALVKDFKTDMSKS